MTKRYGDPNAKLSSYTDEIGATSQVLALDNHYPKLYFRGWEACTCFKNLSLYGLPNGWTISVDLTDRGFFYPLWAPD